MSDERKRMSEDLLTGIECRFGEHAGRKLYHQDLILLMAAEIRACWQERQNICEAWWKQRDAQKQVLTDTNTEWSALLDNAWALQAENERLRAALTEIIEYPQHCRFSSKRVNEECGDLADIARKALAGEPDGEEEG